MPNLYLGQWETVTANSITFRRPPGGDAVGCLNLAPDHGLFAYPAPRVHPLLRRDLGTDIEGQTRLVDRSALSTLLGIGLIQQTRVLDIIKELYVVHADPTGVTRWKPVQFSRNNGFEVYLEGWGRIIAEPRSPSHPAWQPTIDVFRADYRRNKTAGVPLASLRRWTGDTMLRLFGAMSDDRAAAILPSEHLSDGWAPPTTTITDDFTRADADALGTSSEGWSWVEQVGDIDLVTNKAQNGQFGASRATANSNLSSANHYAQGSCDTSSDANYVDCGTTVREASTPGGNHYLCKQEWGGDAVEQWENFNGSYTLFGSVASAVAPGTPFTLKTQIDGSTLKVFIDGVDKRTQTNGDITGNLQTGIYMNKAVAGTVTVDNFEAADLAAAAGHPTMRRWGHVTHLPTTSPRSSGIR